MWNVVVAEIALRIFRIPVHREESILKNNKRITMAQYENNLRRTVSKIGHNNQSICVIFGAPHLAKPGLMAGVRWQVSDKILVA